MFYSFCWWLCMIWIRVMYHVEIVGRENVPRDRGYILAANHRTNMDPIFVAAGVRAPIRYMAKVELFQKGKLFSWLLHRLGAFPVERGKGDTGAVEWAEQVVRSGAVLGMFPEGTRSKDGTPGKPKSGAVSYTHLRAHETGRNLVCRLLLEKKKRKNKKTENRTRRKQQEYHN